MKEPPPLAVPADVSNMPEPVKLRVSPARIGVPGMVACATAEFGPMRLNEEAVEDADAKAVWERENASTEARTSTVSLDFLAIISFVMPKQMVF